MDIKDVRLAVEKQLKDLGIEVAIRIASAKFYQGYRDVIVVYSRDIEVGDKKQKTGVIAALVINDTTGKVEAFKENLT
ncbi:MAG: hypothetical protein ACP5OC_08335 [Thermoplasmata archaeon]